MQTQPAETLQYCEHSSGSVACRATRSFAVGMAVMVEARRAMLAVKVKETMIMILDVKFERRTNCGSIVVTIEIERAKIDAVLIFPTVHPFI